MIRKNIVGEKFGRLLVLSEYKDSKNRHRCECKCDCGNIKDCCKYSLIRGVVKSCGCYRKELVSEMGKNNRKNECKCTYCGKPEHYSKGLCKACYNRLRRNGFLEKKNGRKIDEK